MEELLIEDKKYISLKRAAKDTGYAKDYVGQLCREGKVQARLIGRNWYVLETAMQDHRFGAPKAAEPAPKPKVIETWEEPRYEAAPVPELPVVEEKKEDEDTTSAHYLHEAWNEWFERFDTATKTVVGADQPKAERADPAEIEKEEAKSVDIPIRTIEATPLPEPLPKIKGEKVLAIPEEEDDIPPLQRAKGRKGFYRALQGALMLVALISAASAALGTGYFDAEIASYRQVSSLAGVIYFNK